jgi:hypothetical protein
MCGFSSIRFQKIFTFAILGRERWAALVSHLGAVASLAVLAWALDDGSHVRVSLGCG